MPTVTSSSAAVVVVPPASSDTVSAVVLSTKTTQSDSIVSAAAVSTSQPQDPASTAIQTSTGSITTATQTLSDSPTAVAQTQSDLPTSTQTALSGNNNNGNGFQVPSNTILPAATHTTTGDHSGGSSAAAAGAVSSSKGVMAGPVVGGVIGSVAVIALLGFIFWYFRRRKMGRESLLTPLTTGRRTSFYDNDGGASIGPTGRGIRWKSALGYRIDQVRTVGSGIKSGVVGIGASLKSKVARDRSDSPSVNLNRGNSQFLDGPIPQHSRNNSVLTDGDEKMTLKEKAADFWDNVKDKLSRLRKKDDEPSDVFAYARGVTEKQATLNGQPDFSQLLGKSERDLQLQAERRRMSFPENGTVPQLGSLGLNFGTPGDNPFADPIAGATKPSNPFADPVTRPERSVPKDNTYITDTRRSRGQSIDQGKSNLPSNNINSIYRPPSTAVASRYPSTIAPSRDSYRSTVYSNFTSNARKGKGRSDPFDLEGSLKSGNSMDMYPSPLTSSRWPPAQSSQNQPPKPRRTDSTMSATSKYSSGVSSLGDWGDPGPDLGPGSGASSLREIGNEKGYREELEERRAKDNVSPVSQLSKVSSKGGVGKAM